MKKEFNMDEYNRLRKLKEDFDNYLIKEEDIEKEDVFLINKMYDFEIKNVTEQIKDLEEKIENYKQRLVEAIKYFEDKKINEK